MAYFDLVGMESADRKTASLLGYKKIFSAKEIVLTDNVNLGEPCIVISNEPGTLGRALRKGNVEGVMIKDNELIRQAVEECREHEKLLCFSARELTAVDTRTRMRNLYRMRGLMAFALRSRARIALITLAKDESEMLSSMQMTGLAKFLGASEEQAERMISSLGEIL